jgi:hypothetical protein
MSGGGAFFGAVSGMANTGDPLAERSKDTNGRNWSTAASYLTNHLALGKELLFANISDQMPSDAWYDAAMNLLRRHKNTYGEDFASYIAVPTCRLIRNVDVYKQYMVALTEVAKLADRGYKERGHNPHEVLYALFPTTLNDYTKYARGLKEYRQTLRDHNPALELPACEALDADTSSYAENISERNKGMVRLQRGYHEALGAHIAYLNEGGRRSVTAKRYAEEDRTKIAPMPYPQMQPQMVVGYAVSHASAHPHGMSAAGLYGGPSVPDGAYFGHNSMPMPGAIPAAAQARESVMMDKVLGMPSVSGLTLRGERGEDRDRKPVAM